MKPLRASPMVAFACLAMLATFSGPAVASADVSTTLSTSITQRVGHLPAASATATRSATGHITVKVTTTGSRVLVSYRFAGKNASKRAQLRAGRWTASLPGAASTIRFRYSSGNRTSRWTSVRTPPKTLKTAPLPAEEQQFAFVSGTRQSPVRWHTCAPMTWRINTGGVAEVARLSQALDQVTAATGIRYTQQDSPEATVTFDLQWTNDASLGGSTALSWSTNSFQLPRLNPPTVHLKVGSQSSPAMRTKLYLHELGHVMGLTHVTSRLEIMADSWNSGVTSFGPGDINGLAKLGVQAGCLLPPAAPTDAQITASSAGRMLSWQQAASAGPVLQTRVFLLTTCTDGTACSVPVGSAVPAGATSLIVGTALCSANRTYLITASNAYGDASTLFRPAGCP